MTIKTSLRAINQIIIPFFPLRDSKEKVKNYQVRLIYKSYFLITNSDRFNELLYITKCIFGLANVPNCNVFQWLFFPTKINGSETIRGKSKVGFFFVFDILFPWKGCLPECSSIERKSRACHVSFFFLSAAKRSILSDNVSKTCEFLLSPSPPFSLTRRKNVLSSIFFPVVDYADNKSLNIDFHCN